MGKERYLMGERGERLHSGQRIVGKEKNGGNFPLEASARKRRKGREWFEISPRRLVGRLIERYRMQSGDQLFRMRI